MKAKLHCIHQFRTLCLRTLITLGMIALLGCSERAMAQWTTSGSDIYNSNTGNVGIGTSTPSAKLDLTSTAAGTVTVKIKGAASQTGNLLEFRASDNSLRSYVNPAGALFFNPAMDQVAAAITIAPNFNGQYYASSEHNTFTIDGANMVNYGLYTNPPVRMFQIKDVNGFRAVEVNKLGMMTLRGDMSNRGWVTNVYVDSSNAYYAGDADGLLISGAGLTNHGLYTGGNVRMLRVVGTGEALAVTRYNLTGFGTLNPAARVDIIGTGNTSASTSLSVKNSSSTSLLFVRDDGNVGIGTTSPIAKLHVGGDGKVTGNLTVDGNIAAKYQDVAEWVPAARALPAGTVVTLNPNQSNLVEASSKAYDTGVAGVISEQPGITLGERSANKVLVATTGRVRVKVDATTAPIHIGDLLVTSDTPGMAMKSEPITMGGRQIHSPGTLIGKALEPLAKGQGEILVLLSLQ